MWEHEPTQCSGSGRIRAGELHAGPEFLFFAKLNSSAVYAERSPERPFCVVSYCYDPSLLRGYVHSGPRRKVVSPRHNFFVVWKENWFFSLPLFLPDPPQSVSVTPVSSNCDECHRMKNRLGLNW